MPTTRSQQMRKVHDINASVANQVRYEEDRWPWMVAVPDPRNTDHILLMVPYDGCDGEKLLNDWVWSTAEEHSVSGEWFMIAGFPTDFSGNMDGACVQWPALPGDAGRVMRGELWVLHLVTRALLENAAFQKLPIDPTSQFATFATVGEWWTECKVELANLEQDD